MSTPFHILIVDDHAVMIDGLRILLEVRFPTATFSTATSLHDALALDCSPDLVILDVMMPGLSGLEGVALIKRRWGNGRVAILSSLDDAETCRIALARGADAFLSKREGGDRIVQMVEDLLATDAIVPKAELDSPCLTPRQCEVLELISRGLTNKLIARSLKLSDNTVRRHLQNIFASLGVATRTEAVFAARRLGLLDRTCP